jgi:hypothetical protein
VYQNRPSTIDCCGERGRGGLVDNSFPSRSSASQADKGQPSANTHRHASRWTTNATGMPLPHYSLPAPLHFLLLHLPLAFASSLYHGIDSDPCCTWRAYPDSEVISFAKQMTRPEATKKLRLPDAPLCLACKAKKETPEPLPSLSRGRRGGQTLAVAAPLPGPLFHCAAA